MIDDINSKCLFGFIIKKKRRQKDRNKQNANAEICTFNEIVRTQIKTTAVYGLTAIRNS